MTWPTVTIVIANYNGRAHLERGLTAVAALDYPRDRYRVIVVDDASKDGSAAFVAERFPGVDVIRLPHNVGFAAATNQGFARSRTDFVVALNNDTVVSPSWLGELIQPALADPTVGLCTGKLLFPRDRLRVRIARADFREPVPPPRAAWLDGEPTKVERVGFPNPLFLELGLAVDPGQRPRDVLFSVDALPGTPYDVWIGGGDSRRFVVTSEGVLRAPIDADAAIRPVVQNAGLVVFRDGRGRDRGAVAGPGFHYYQDDLGQFDRAEEVFAGCGASLLARSAALADVGPFDERFFAYYEDVDLSWRARLRGWKVIYAPRAVVRHAHRGTTGGWSDAFVYYTERNRLMLLVKLAPAERVLEQLGNALARAGWTSLAAARRAARGRDPSQTWAGPRWAGLVSLTRQLPGLLASRARIQARRRVGRADIDRWLRDEQ
jgi:GT2 family glycosyltransferase